MLNPGSNNEGRMEGKLKKYSQKGYDLMVPVEMWDGISWSYEVDR